MTLWVVARSPLMIGGDLPSSDPATVALFTNTAVLAVHRDATGSREVLRDDPLVLWAAGGPGRTRYVAAFNLGDDVLPVALDANDLGLSAGQDGELRELWTGTPVPTTPVRAQDEGAPGVAPGGTALHLTLAPHGAALLRWTQGAPCSRRGAAATRHRRSYRPLASR